MVAAAGSSAIEGTEAGGAGGWREGGQRCSSRRRGDGSLARWLPTAHPGLRCTAAATAGSLAHCSQSSTRPNAALPPRWLRFLLLLVRMPSLPLWLRSGLRSDACHRGVDLVSLSSSSCSSLSRSFSSPPRPRHVRLPLAVPLLLERMLTSLVPPRSTTTVPSLKPFTRLPSPCANCTCSVRPSPPLSVADQASELNPRPPIANGLRSPTLVRAASQGSRRRGRHYARWAGRGRAELERERAQEPRARDCASGSACLSAFPPAHTHSLSLSNASVTVAD